jgi:hypothetical protein
VLRRAALRFGAAEHEIEVELLNPVRRSLCDQIPVQLQGTGSGPAGHGLADASAADAGVEQFVNKAPGLVCVHQRAWSLPVGANGEDLRLRGWAHAYDLSAPDAGEY